MTLIEPTAFVIDKTVTTATQVPTGKIILFSQKVQRDAQLNGRPFWSFEDSVDRRVCEWGIDISGGNNVFDFTPSGTDLGIMTTSTIYTVDVFINYTAGVSNPAIFIVNGSEMSETGDCSDEFNLVDTPASSMAFYVTDGTQTVPANDLWWDDVMITESIFPENITIKFGATTKFIPPPNATAFTDVVQSINAGAGRSWGNITLLTGDGITLTQTSGLNANITISNNTNVCFYNREGVFTAIQFFTSNVNVSGTINTTTIIAQNYLNIPKNESGINRTVSINLTTENNTLSIPLPSDSNIITIEGRIQGLTAAGALQITFNGDNQTNYGIQRLTNTTFTTVSNAASARFEATTTTLNRTFFMKIYKTGAGMVAGDYTIIWLRNVKGSAPTVVRGAYIWSNLTTGIIPSDITIRSSFVTANFVPGTYLTVRGEKI